MDVTVIIVNYNTKQLTDQCIRSVLEFTENISYEIIIVDNASNDGSQEYIKYNFPSVILIENKENIGFGRANNLGAKVAIGEYLFLLNSDCILIENSIKKMYDFFESQNSNKNRIGAVGCLLLDENYNLNTSYHKFPTPPKQILFLIINLINKVFNSSFKIKNEVNYPLDKNREVDFITGADLFIPFEIFTSLNGFDPRFFMYFEETDLQKRMENVSLKRVMLDDISIIHLEGGSTPKKLSSKTIYIDSELKYTRKHFSKIVYLFYYLIRAISLIPDLLACSQSKIDREKLLKMIINNR